MSDIMQWYHIITSVYGAWLYGDSRGFRTRHHREHVEGDYKNPPPPGTYNDGLLRSRSLLKQSPVVIPAPLRPVVGNAIREKLEALGSLVVCLSVSGQHLHVLAKTEIMHARERMGIAKKHAWFEVRQHGWKGKLWAKRGKELPVKDRPHQLNVYYYILRHAREGAWVWSLVRERRK
jgi:hypothetical protein